MIIYNNRYRGPFEYDKFILNVFGFSNEINETLIHEFKNKNSKSFNEYTELVNNAYDNTLKLSNDIHSFLLNYKKVGEI